MTCKAIVVDENKEIETAVSILLRKNISCLPVVSQKTRSKESYLGKMFLGFAAQNEIPIGPIIAPVTTVELLGSAVRKTAGSRQVPCDRIKN